MRTTPTSTKQGLPDLQQNDLSCSVSQETPQTLGKAPRSYWDLEMSRLYINKFIISVTISFLALNPLLEFIKKKKKNAAFTL